LEGVDMARARFLQGALNPAGFLVYLGSVTRNVESDCSEVGSSYGHSNCHGTLEVIDQRIVMNTLFDPADNPIDDVVFLEGNEFVQSDPFGEPEEKWVTCSKRVSVPEHLLYVC
jgi:hypothetical protein